MELGFPHRGGRCRPERTRFSSPFVLFLYIWNFPWTGDGKLSSPVDAGSITYEPQPIRDRPVGGTGDFHTVREGINSGDTSVFVPGLSELYISEWMMVLGMDSIVSRWRLLYVRSPANGRPAIRQKAHTRYYYMFYFRLKLHRA